MAYRAQIGDTVAYTAKFLRSIGDYSAETANMRGKVVPGGKTFGDRTLVRVLWEGDTESKLVRECNVCKPGTVSFSD